MQWVFDASVALAWCFEDERSPQSDALLDRAAVQPSCVPQHWALEVANVLVLASRRGRIPAAKRAQFLSLLQNLPIHVDPAPQSHALSATIALADEHGLTSYDAAYLELAIRLGVPFATLDHDLIAASKKLALTLL